MTSPTAHRVVAAGERIVASGGVFPALIVTVSVSEAPSGSVTRSRTV